MLKPDILSTITSPLTVNTGHEVKEIACGVYWYQFNIFMCSDQWLRNSYLLGLFCPMQVSLIACLMMRRIHTPSME